MKKSYITIVSKDDHKNREPIYEISDSETETLIALKTRPMTKDDIASDVWDSPQEWLSHDAKLHWLVSNTDKNVNLYVASSYNEIKDIASEYNLKTIQEA